MLPCSLYPSRLFLLLFSSSSSFFITVVKKRMKRRVKEGKKGNGAFSFLLEKLPLHLRKESLVPAFDAKKGGEKSRLFFSLHRSIALRREGPNDGPSDPFHLGPSRIPSISQRKGREIRNKVFLSSIALIRHKKVFLHSGQFAQLLFKKTFFPFHPPWELKGCKGCRFFPDVSFPVGEQILLHLFGTES